MPKAPDTNSKTSSLKGIFKEAVTHHREGRLQEAEKLYQTILQERSDHPGANHKFGIMLEQRGEQELALCHLRRAWESESEDEEIAVSLLHALIKAGEFGEARIVLERGPAGAVESEGVESLASKLREAEREKILVPFNAGRYAEAEEAARCFVRRHPEELFGHKALGAILCQSGRHREALPVLKRALSIRSDTDVLNSYGTSLQELGRLEEAVETFQRAAELNPDCAQAYYNKGNALGKMGKLSQSLSSYQKSIEIDPSYARAYYNAGGVLQQLGKPGEALQNYEKAIELKPDYAEAFNNRGNVLEDRGDLQKALQSYKNAIELRGDFAGAYSNAANVLQKLGRLKEALRSAQKATELDPDSPEAQNTTGNVLQQLGRVEEALAHYKKVVRAERDSAKTHHNIGNVLKDLGRFEEAKESFDLAIEKNPALVAPRYERMQLLRGCPGGKTSDIFKEIANDPERPLEDQMLAHFALGDMHSEVDEYDEAFSHYTQAHRCRQKNRGTKYHRESDRTKLLNYTELIDREFLEKRLEWCGSSEKPIFIVGFPRSSTSLVEQILASHSRLCGLGERHEISGFASRISQFTDREKACDAFNDLGKHNLKRMAREYLDSSYRFCSINQTPVDKMPHNFQHLWLICLMFPRARILHCTRNALDTCMSCFSTKFARWHPYTDDLRSLGHHYGFYRKLMAHWEDILPVDIHEISYEQLVRSPEREIRSLVRTCGLEFEESCLEFHKTRRAVTTASATQVRRPIYTSSIGKWRHYKKHLTPLRETLEEEGVKLAEGT